MPVSYTHLDVAFAMVLHGRFKFCLAVCGFLFDVPPELGADALQVLSKSLQALASMR